MLVQFTADWCGNCHWLEATVLNSDTVVQFLQQKQVIMLKADVTADSAPGLKLLSQLSDVGGIPLTALYLGDNPPVLLSGIYSSAELRHTVEQLTKSPAAVTLAQ